MLAFACAFTMFAGAASFTDQADINTDNVEAVDLLTTLGIIKGYEDGSFNPEGTVTRAEMAKMIYTIRNGGNDDASAHIGNTTSFTDISGHWAEGYIKYLQNTGIVAGKSATKFDPDSQVTTTEAMKMALALAGYDEEHAGLTGINWATNTLTYATTYGLTDNVASAMSAGCARQDAAQILANCLDMTAVRWSAVVEDFVNDSKDGLAFSGDPISVGYKWMDLCTDIGVITDLDGSTIDLLIPDTDKPDSYDKDDNVQFTRIGTDYSALLGQRVKVLFNDGRHNDVIGVFALPDNEVITVYKNEIDAENARIKIDGTLYSLENDGVHAIIDGEEAAKNWNAVDFEDGNSPDIVTLIDSDDNGKIDNAVIKTVDVQKVTYVSSTQIIAGEKTYKFADETIDEDVARNDYVMITENLFNENKDIVVVDKQTGEVAATKGSNGAYTDYQFGDNWYVAADDRSDINAAVRPGVNAEYVAVNNVLFYAARVTGSSSLEDVLFVALVGTDGLSRDQAVVMFPDGDKETITLASRYEYDENGDETGTPVTAGQFYEFNKSGNSYELSLAREYVEGVAADGTNPFANEDNEDYYGEYTYWGADEQLDGMVARNDAAVPAVDGQGPDSVLNVAAIDDNADVILYQAIDEDDDVIKNVNQVGNADDYEIKHITGKQLKSNGDQLHGGNLAVTALGVFTSDVSNLMRSTVVAVLYTGDDWASDTAGLLSNANYGFIISTPKNVNGGIEFEMFTGDSSEDAVTVWADKSSTARFEKGAVIGYSEIVVEDGRNVIVDATRIDNVTAGTISNVKSSNDVIVVGGVEIELDEFNTVIYTNSYNDTITKDVDGVPTKSDEGRTNILFVRDSFAIIDSNEIVGQVYATNDVDYTGVNNNSVASLQWTNPSTGETRDYVDMKQAYTNSKWNLSITTKTAGTLTVTDTENDKTLISKELAAGRNYNEDLFGTITVQGNIMVTYETAAAVVPTHVNILSAVFAPNWTYGDDTHVNVDVVYENALGYRPTIAIYAEGSDTDLVGTDFTVGDTFTLTDTDDRTAQSNTVTIDDETLPGNYKLVVTIGDDHETIPFTVAAKQAVVSLKLADLPDGANMVSDYETYRFKGYEGREGFAGNQLTASGATTWSWRNETTEWTPGAEIANIRLGDIYRAEITLTASAGYSFAGIEASDVTLVDAYNDVSDFYEVTVTHNADGTLTIYATMVD